MAYPGRSRVGLSKTRTGAEWVRDQIENKGKKRIALVGPTAADARDVMVEGQSGLLNIFREEDRPLYEPTKRRVTFTNGAIATLYSSEEPERLRGPQHDAAWLDELCAWTRLEATYDQLQFGLRLGNNPQAVITTTPKPLPLLRKIIKDARTRVTKGSTFDNKANLAEKFIAEIVKKYEGTRLGRQELRAEILDDVVGALWTWDMIERSRYGGIYPDFSLKVVAIDPSVGDGNPENDECGIVGAGLGRDGFGYVLHDGSMSGTPDEWVSKAVMMYHALQAQYIVAEQNNGGKLIESAIRAHKDGKHIPIRLVSASQGKRTRAEPVSMLYEQCVAAGTMVATSRGQVPIELVRANDYVWTRAGLQRVEWSGQTGIKPTVKVSADGYELVCTEDHPIFTTTRGFQSAGHLCPLKDKIGVWEHQLSTNPTTVLTAALRCLNKESDAVLARRPIGGDTPESSLETLLSLTGGDITGSLMDITVPDNTAETSCSIGRFGSRETVPFPMDGTFITSTAIPATTDPKTLLRYLQAITPINTRASLILKKLVALLGKKQKLAGRRASLLDTSVNYAEKSFTQPGLSQSGARRFVISERFVKTIQATTKEEPVYNLTVENQPEFFANGILVHNCRIRHFGVFPDLESQLCGWSPVDSEFSPGRLDALVWAFTSLMVKSPAEFFCFVG